MSLAYVVRRHICLDFLGLLVRTPGPVPSALSSSMNFYDVLFTHVLQTTKLLQRLLLCLLAPTCGYSGRSALARGEESLHMMWSKRVYFGCWSEWVVWWWSYSESFTRSRSSPTFHGFKAFKTDRKSILRFKMLKFDVNDQWHVASWYLPPNWRCSCSFTWWLRVLVGVIVAGAKATTMDQRWGPDFRCLTLSLRNLHDKCSSFSTR